MNNLLAVHPGESIDGREAGAPLQQHQVDDSSLVL